MTEVAMTKYILGFILGDIFKNASGYLFETAVFME
jgi:hypothetical protein